MTPEPVTLLNLPTVVLSGVVAAAISLAGAVGGVILSNRSSERRLRDQLMHDRTERQRDRLASLRREVYLHLFEELSAVSSHLGSLAGKDPVTENLGGPLQSAMAQLAKVQLVGNEQTAIFAGELSSQFGDSLFRLILAAKPMHDLKIDINVANHAAQEQLAEAQRANREMRALNETDGATPAKMRALQSSFEHAMQQFDEAGKKRDTAWEQFNSLQKPFMHAAFEELKLISPAQAKLMAAMREEMGLSSDLDFMLRRVEDAQLRMRDAADKFLAAFEST